MTNREFDVFIIGLAIGGLACLWVGYWIGARVTRWRLERAARHALPKNMRRYAKNIPFPKPGEDIRFEKSHAKDFGSHQAIPLDRPRQALVLDRGPQAIPLPAAPSGFTRYLQPKACQFIRISNDEFIRVDDTKAEADETAHLNRADAVAAITGVGYKRTAAEAALDACSLAERAGDLEAWVASALRRLATKP